MASADWLAKVCSSATTSGGKAPGVLPVDDQRRPARGPRAAGAPPAGPGSPRAPGARRAAWPCVGALRQDVRAPGPGRASAAARPADALAPGAAGPPAAAPAAPRRAAAAARRRERVRRPRRTRRRAALAPESRRAWATMRASTVSRSRVELTGLRRPRPAPSARPPSAPARACGPAAPGTAGRSRWRSRPGRRRSRSSAICCAVNGRTSCAAGAISAPMASPSRGAAAPPARCGTAGRALAAPPAARPRAPPRGRGRGRPRRRDRHGRRRVDAVAGQRERRRPRCASGAVGRRRESGDGAAASPSTRQISARSAPHSRAALSAIVSSTGCRSVGRPAITAQHLRRGRLLLQRLGERPVALLQLGEQPGVLDGDHGLVGEGLQQRDLLVGERAHLHPRSRVIAPIGRALAAAAARPAWCAARSAGGPRDAGSSASGTAAEVGDVDGRAAPAIARPATGHARGPAGSAGTALQRSRRRLRSRCEPATPRQASPSTRKISAPVGAAERAPRSRRSCPAPAAGRWATG